VITVKDESSDAGLREPAHLERKEKAGMKVAPVAVIEVAGYDDKGNTLVNRLSDEIVKSVAGCRPMRSAAAPSCRVSPMSGLSI